MSVSSFTSTIYSKTKIMDEIQPTGSVRDIQARSWVATRGHARFIVLNHLRVRWKSVTPTARQTK